MMHVPGADPSYYSRLIENAYARINPYVSTTRLIRDTPSGIFLKCENEQRTGSFKWRGALSRLSTIEKGKSIVTASTGNHGLAVATAAGLYDLTAKIFIPASASPKKLQKIKSIGAEVIHVDGDSLLAEMTGKEMAQQHHLTWVSPYNDEQVIAGQGTIGLEVLQQMPDIDQIYITVGGGGLSAGISAWIKSHSPQTEIIGCQPVNSPEMFLSILAGEVVEAPQAINTLSDGSAGPLEEDSITFDLCRSWIDRFILVTEEEIKSAIRYLFQSHDLVVEGAAAVAFASALKDTERKESGNAIVILCGGNIDETTHQQICSEQ
jgi:threonine dehydratase